MIEFFAARIRQGQRDGDVGQDVDSRAQALLAGPALVLMHTVRGQLDYFQRVIPLLWDHYTVYALDLPGMGWSDIVPGAQYEEPQLRAAVVEFVRGLDLHDVTLSGESLGGALSLSASIDLKGRVSRVVAFNSYDYPQGGERGNWISRHHLQRADARAGPRLRPPLSRGPSSGQFCRAATSTRPGCPRTSSPSY
ncbi:alpha/beta fold hydrolase [Streptomyces sp. NPDC051677]|uniref:alpha/beta fold hydrolase n=1 Tax=Streptomyces sp. NPDC051677 TaxID=3365669 RepID=UPI0037CF303E